MDDGAPSNPSLCLSCGLCCDGTLFGYVPLAEHELSRAERAGLRVEPFADGLGFAQPCVQFCGTSCAIYGSRPAACRAYRCATLKALETGEIDRAEAEHRVASAHEAARRVLAALQSGETIEGARRRLASEPGEVSAALKLALGVLELVLDRSFRSPRQRRLRGDGQAAGMAD